MNLGLLPHLIHEKYMNYLIICLRELITYSTSESSIKGPIGKLRISLEIESVTGKDSFFATIS